MSPMPPPLQHVPPCTGAQLPELETVFRRHVRRLRLAYHAWLGAAAPYIDDAACNAVAKCLAVVDALDGADGWARRRELLTGDGGVDALNLCVWALTPQVVTRSAAVPAPCGGRGPCEDSAVARRRLLMASLRIVACVEYYTTQIALIVGCATEVIRNDDELRTCIATLHMNRAAKRSQLAAPAIG